MTKSVDELRKEFEETEFFKIQMNGVHHTFIWFGDNRYYATCMWEKLYTLNGAWFMFQELKK